jgi:hypothetical protein
MFTDAVLHFFYLKENRGALGALTEQGYGLLPQTIISWGTFLDFLSSLRTSYFL